MRTFFISIVFAASALCLAGCAMMTGVSDQPVTAGAMHEYAASYDLVKAAALEAVERLNVNVQGSDETTERFQIRLSKSISAFSWGEVGVVNVVRADAQHTRVYVQTFKRDELQITGTQQHTFAEHIFSDLTESLARLQQ